MEHIHRGMTQDPVLVAQRASNDFLALHKLRDQYLQSNHPDARQLIRVSMEAIDVRYGAPAGLALEGENTFFERLKGLMKRVLQAIIETIEYLVSTFNRYREAANRIYEEVELIQRQVRGHIGVQRLDVKIESRQLSTALFVSKGGNNLREAYQRTISLAKDSYSAMDYAKLDHFLSAFKSASGAEVTVLSKELLQHLNKSVQDLLGNSNPPSFLRERDSHPHSTLYCAGPFLGEKYIFGYCPNDVEHLSEFNVAMARNHEAMLPRERLPALSSTDIWEVCHQARAFADVIYEFGVLNNKLKSMLATAKGMGTHTEDPHLIAAIAVFPAALRSALHVGLNLGVESTFSMLDYCFKSVRALVKAEK